MYPRFVRLLDAAVPVVVGALIVVGTLLSGVSVRPLTLAVGLAAAAALLARRRAPGWTLAGSGALVLVLFGIDRSAGAVAVLAPAVALYSLALTRGRRQQLLGAVAVVGAVILADALAPTRDSLIAPMLGHIALVAVPLLAAEALRTRHSYMALLRERLELAEQTREQEAQRRAEQERMRIARELHDVVAHTLTTINVQAGAAAERLAPGQARAALETIEHASHDAIGELRAILGVLRDRADAPRAPTPSVDNVAELVQHARDAGLDVGLETGGQRPSRLSDAVSLAAYRIVQESLTNAQRHAPGAAVRVNLRFDPARLSITIDNGASTRPTSNGRPGVGIAGMLERASAIGGTLRAGPNRNGFRVQAELPHQPSR